jgi:hypothetical protein
MTLWKNNAFANGTNTPAYANNNTDRGLRYAANNVYGVKTGEKGNTSGQGPNVAHSGWVYFDLGRGPLATLNIANGGVGINSNGFLNVSGGGGTGANIAFYIGNAQTAAIGFSTNPLLNVVVNVVVASGGSGYNTAPNVWFSGVGGWPIANGNFQPSMGGRSGRPISEVLVAMSTIVGDVSTGNIHFPGVV